LFSRSCEGAGCVQCLGGRRKGGPPDLGCVCNDEPHKKTLPHVPTWNPSIAERYPLRHDCTLGKIPLESRNLTGADAKRCERMRDRLNSDLCPTSREAREHPKKRGLFHDTSASKPFSFALSTCPSLPPVSRSWKKSRHFLRAAVRIWKTRLRMILCSRCTVQRPGRLDTLFGYIPKLSLKLSLTPSASTDLPKS